MIDVAAVLTASRAAHDRGRRAFAKGDYQTGAAAYDEALTLRRQARAADPERTSAGWVADTQNTTGVALRDKRKTQAELIAHQDEAIEAFLLDALGHTAQSPVKVHAPEVVPAPGQALEDSEAFKRSQE